MPGDVAPTRSQSDLADMVEMLLDKGVVVNADIVVSVGDTELLGVEVRAAIASFETAAKYGLEFPAGTDTDRLERAARGERPLDPDAGGDANARERSESGADDTERARVETGSEDESQSEGDDGQPQSDSGREAAAASTDSDGEGER